MADIVLFGITGDLAKNKLVPALARVSEYKKIRIIGFGRKPFSPKEFTEYLRDTAKKNGALFSPETLRESVYVQSELNNLTGYLKLHKIVTETACLYIALPPEFQMPVSKLLIQSETLSKKSNRRIVFEKPYGTSTASAEKLNSYLSKAVRVDQILRVDHYAGKETLLDLEHAGRIGIQSFIASVQGITGITVSFKEKKTADTRAVFYDSVGALADVAQNHMLHMLVTFLTSFGEQCVYNDSGNDTCVVSSSVSQVLQQIRSVISDSVTVVSGTHKPFIAQYVGFRNLPGVRKDTRTETYFKFSLSLKKPKGGALQKVSLEAQNSILRIYTIFKNTKITFIGGKGMPENDVSVTMKLRNNAYKLMVNKSCGKDAYDEICTALVESNWNRFVTFEQALAGWKIVEEVHKKKSKKIREYLVGTEPTA